MRIARYYRPTAQRFFARGGLACATLQARSLPAWPRYQSGSRRVLHLDETIRDAAAKHRPRYDALDVYTEENRGK